MERYEKQDDDNASPFRAEAGRQSLPVRVMIETGKEEQ